VGGFSSGLQMVVRAEDPYTQGHSQSVSRIAAQIARQMGLPDSAIEEIRVGGILHDIGKNRLPEAILSKPSRLTPEEYEVMKSHTVLGVDIFFASKTIDWVRMNIRNHHEAFDGSGYYQRAIEVIRGIVRNHHERVDGTGYPDGLKGENIPLGARIVAVAESFDNMVSELPYRPGRSVEDAVAELRRCSGTQFDPDIVEALVRSLETSGEPKLKSP